MVRRKPVDAPTRATVAILLDDNGLDWRKGGEGWMRGNFGNLHEEKEVSHLYQPSRGQWRPMKDVSYGGIYGRIV